MPKAVIMAGGLGERFWPLTHKKFPKYRICLDGKRSLLQRTYERLQKVYGREDVYVVTTREHARMVSKELPGLGSKNILIEPFRNNTACAILFSTAYMQKRFGDSEIVSFFPADHLIQNEGLFKKTIRSAISVARKTKHLVTIGIEPTFPATGYGYVQRGRTIQGAPDAFIVKRFTEKPNRKLAQRYLRNKNYYWNGGIFTWRTDVFLSTLNKFSPAISKAFDINDVKHSYGRLPNISIDYALLEKTNNLIVLRTSMDWCDMGSWDMFLEKAATDKKGNFVIGRSHLEDSKDLLLLNYRSTPLISLGVKGLIVVQTEMGTLICKRTRSEEAALLSRRG